MIWQRTATARSVEKNLMLALIVLSVPVVDVMGTVLSYGNYSSAWGAGRVGGACFALVPLTSLDQLRPAKRVK